MQPADIHTLSQVPHAPLPAIALSIAEGIATITLEPHVRELTASEKKAVLAANRIRVFIDGRVAGNLSRKPPAPIKLSDYPADTLRFCFQHATLVCVGVVDCRKEQSADDVESLLRRFDGKDVEDSRFVIRMLTDAPYDVGDYISRHRPYVPFRIASPHYTETVEGDA
ncbi:hypothetical protein [Bradyrhizobium canariense]|nr:hypothetical protein [Bradyrhizobium canariense]OSI69928.1 hypothetical protein BSZ22_15895 [Bradyrhizobium canariense]OSI74928.1 hypothetical protein BSZ23_32050 [Bradyrhizobium canariense]OSI86571.1 hypothetical protein BSZ25_30625 [Bradyrhizobium canariense]